MIAGFGSRDEFARKLNTLVSPSRPIQTQEHLFGREKELDRIEKALYADGRHIFIYGDRGVGKSSLAAAAANQWQSSDAEYIDVSCSRDASLKTVVVNIVRQAISASNLKSETSTASIGADLRFIKGDRSTETRAVDPFERLQSLPDAVEMLNEAAARHSQRPVVVVDEFNLLDEKERPHFADLLKLLGDKKVNIKFIFTGIGESLQQLLGANQSAIRQLETIELPKLMYQARMDISQSVGAGLGVEVDREHRIRIAQVSDGYPYFVHLITEKLMWRVFEDEQEIKATSQAHYEDAIRDAIESINAELKVPYERALKQRSAGFEPVLWSTADSDYLTRSLKEMYRSYESVMDQMVEVARLNYDTYVNRIRALTKPAVGNILIRDSRPGLYTYQQKMLRGYVRLQAEANHIELRGESGYKLNRPGFSRRLAAILYGKQGGSNESQAVHRGVQG